MQARTQTAHNCGHSSLLSPRMIWIHPMAGRRGEEEKMGVGELSSDIAESDNHSEPLIGGMKYRRRKLKGPGVKIIHDMHIFPS